VLVLVTSFKVQIELPNEGLTEFDSVGLNCLQCFDTVGWASGRASSL